MFCYQRFLWLVIMQLLALLMNLGDAEKQCFHDDESVPFRLVPVKLNSSNPCSRYTRTNIVEMVEFPGVPALQGLGLRLAVVEKHYKSRILELCDVGGCLPELYLRLLNSSIYPFQFESYMLASPNVTLFNCSSIGSKYLKNDDQLPQDLRVCPIYAVSFTDGILEKDVTFCTKMLPLDSPLGPFDFQTNRFRFRWSQPKCAGENFKTILFKYVLPSLGSIALVLCIVFLLLIYRYFKTKGEDHARLKKFLKDYEALKPTRFSYADLKRITNHFKDKIGEGAHGSVFKGKLSNQIMVAVKVLNNSDDDDGKDFINEMGTVGKIHHINVVRLLGILC